MNEKAKAGGWNIVAAVMIILLSLAVLLAGACGGIIYLIAPQLSTLLLALACLVLGVGLFYGAIRLLRSRPPNPSE
jgi:hypothetical protein